MIAWNDKARAQILPRTREAAGPFKPAKPQTIWGIVHKTFGKRGNYEPIEGTFVKGRSLATPDLAALMEKCEPIARSEEVPALDDVDVAAAFFALASKHAHSHMLAFLLATMPVPRAFHVHLRSRDFDVTPKYVNWNNPFYLHAAPANADAFDPEWRKTLLAQSDEVRAECKRIAKDLWPRANLGQKTTIANAFFEEEAWADEVCRAWLAAGPQRNIPLNDLVTDFELAKALVKHKDGSWSYMRLIERFGDAMLPVLIELADAPFDRWHARDVAETLALFDDPRAAGAMVKLLNQASSRPQALAYFGKYPHHAEAALESVATMKGRGAKIAREVLKGAQRAVTGAVKPEDEATLEELPRVLARPPWLDEKKPKKPHTALALERVDLPESIDWPPGERERALKLFPKPEKPATPETLTEYAEQRAANKFVDVVKHKNEALPDELVLEAWNAGQKTYQGTLGKKVAYILAKYGEAAYPGLSEFVDHFANGWGDAPVLLRVRSWRLALPLAQHVAHRRIGKLAWAWLQRHAELAVLALVPPAFGGDKDDREHAERALFRLKASGVDVVGIGARYGEEANAALEKLFSWDPVYDLPKTIPKLGPSWHPETLTRPRLLGGKALPLAALDTIATMLAFSPLDPPYAGLVQVKEACDARSLAELAWDAARAWENAGHKKKEQWMLMSLVHFADDEVVRRLTPGMRPDFAVQALEVIATDAALMEMATIAGRTASQGSEGTLGGRIEKLLDAAADARGMTKDELEEDLAPTADLDEEGSLSLDFGPRKVKVGFDESLVPYVKNDSGTRGRALPPARKDDDPDKADRAKTIWRDLKEDVTVIASRRIKALERAMMTGRTWTRERFERVWLDHSLMKHMARGVLWTELRGAESVAFRVAEDGSLSNVEDAPHVLAERAKIGVAHPLRLLKGDVEKWRTIFEDYKVVQPFMQLGRTYPNLDKAATRVPWPMPATKAGDLSSHLRERGFVHAAWNKGRQTFSRQLPSGGFLHVEFASDKNVVTDGALVFMVDGPKEVAAGELDPIHLADAIYAINAP
jgi:hypothetical protein